MALRQFRHLSSKLLGQHPAQCNCQSVLGALPLNRAVLCTPRTAVATTTQRALTTAVRPFTSRDRERSSLGDLSVRAYSASEPTEKDRDETDKTFSSSTTTPTASSVDVPKQSMKDKLKTLWKQYGVIAVGTYFSIYFGTLGSLFLALDYNVFSSSTFGLDPAVAIDKFCHIYEMITSDTHLPEYIREHPAVGTFGIAYVMTKFTEPLRLAGTIAVVPTIARWLGHRRELHEEAPHHKQEQEQEKEKEKKESK